MILAQHGYGPSDRVEIGLADGSIKGVIVSASNTTPDQLGAYCLTVLKAQTEAVMLFDPEYYVNFIQEADKFGKLADYDYFSHPMAPSDLASPKLLQETTKKVIDLQISNGFKKVTSPTLEISSFGSANEPYSLSLLNASAEYIASDHPEAELYGSLLINENAFYDVERMALFLDAITRVKGLKGFYVVIDRSDSQKYFWSNPQTLAAYMYLIHTLSTNKSVILGYSDGAALLGLAVGAEYVSNGWWQNSGNFTKKRFVSSGGRRRATYYSKQLMSTVYVDGELSVLVQRGHKDAVANSTKYDDAVSSNPLDPASWNERDAVFHKWVALSEYDAEITALATEDERLDYLVSKISTAKDLSETMNGILPDGFNTNHGPEKLRTWLAAIDQYRKGVV